MHIAKLSLIAVFCLSFAFTGCNLFSFVYNIIDLCVHKFIVRVYVLLN